MCRFLLARSYWGRLDSQVAVETPTIASERATHELRLPIV
jgi:hypothetical protein